MGISAFRMTFAALAATAAAIVIMPAVAAPAPRDYRIIFNPASSSFARFFRLKAAER